MNNINESYLELTAIQKGILFESLQSYNHASYIGQMIMDWKNELNLSLFSKTIEIISDQHPVFRSSIYSDTVLLQIIHSSIITPITYIDYTSYDEKIQCKKYFQFLNKDIKNTFNLTQPPLMRFTIIKLNDQHFKIIWTRHHLIIDGVSANKIINELLTIYQLLLKNNSYQIQSPDQYNTVLSRVNLEQTLANSINWRTSLKGYEEAALLPPTSKNTNKKIKKKVIKCEIKKNDYLNLRSFVVENSYSINIILQAAWALVLYLYSNKEKCIFGNVRAYPENMVKDTIGLFINTLPVMIHTNENIKTKEFINHVKEQNAFLKANIYKSLHSVKEDLNLTSEMPLFFTILDYKPFRLNATANDKFKDFNLDVKLRLEIPYSIVIEVSDDGKSFEIKMNYDANMFKSYHAHQILNYYKKFINLIVASSDNYISDIIQRAMSASYNKIIKEFNNTKNLIPRVTIHHLFEQKVKENPNALALYYNNETLSYAELNKRANKLANYLITRDFPGETIIALCLKPDFNMMIAILAILKAGYAYIVIDINYPEQRIKYILDDCNPLFILSTSNIQLPDIDQPIALLDKLDFSRFPDANPDLDLCLNQLMYINYTSGSTGTPKGVSIEHASAVNTALACIEKFKLGSDSRILQIASPSFDVAVAEWMMALLSGGCLYLITKDIFSPSEITSALKNFRITAIILSSSILSALPISDLPDLKVIAVGGENISKNMVLNWYKNRSLYNVYGVTEATICTTMTSVNIQKKLTVGKPLSNTRVYILNKNLNLVPIYGIGEIFIGGDGVSRGYINNSNLTKQKFINDFFHQHSKLYRSGDLGRWLPSGELEILGRIDDQVKIKGIRIELSEIEKTLERFPKLKKAVVLVNESSNYKSLVAYIELQHQFRERNYLINIKQFLQKYLPIYMLPKDIIIITTWPLTSNGKIDKIKLKSLIDSDFSSQANEVLVNNKIQEEILIVIKELLNKNIKIDDNFLDMGMDSLRMIELSSKLTTIFQNDISVSALFTYTTVKTLAAYIDRLINNNLDEDFTTLVKQNYNNSYLHKQRIRFSDE